MKNAIITAVLFFLFVNGYSQSVDISFSIDKDSTSRQKDNDLIKKIEIKKEGIKDVEAAKYNLIVSVNQEKTTMSQNSYFLDTRKILADDLKTSHFIYLTIFKDDQPDRDRKIVLKLTIEPVEGDIKVTNTGKHQEMELIVSGMQADELSMGYNYLAYVGTNFDLVDGVKAKNLFFATNVFLAPKLKERAGVFLSFYGNRTMSTTDSSYNLRRLSKIVKVTDTSYWRYTEQADLQSSRVSDNLGAYISPLINLWSLSKAKNRTKLYYSPSLEFIWRRTETNRSYTNSRNIDSVLQFGNHLGDIEFSTKTTQFLNEYSFNVGALGFYLVHENKQISMRVYCSVGYSSNYYPQYSSESRTDQPKEYRRSSDMFFTGRAWITEGSTGLTLQAEITNTLINARPFYGVTLSKALNFKNIGTIFQPVTSRN